MILRKINEFEFTLTGIPIFSRINQYFDGKRSDDEILFRAEIRRRQLREVLHHYEPYVSYIAPIYASNKTEN